MMTYSLAVALLPQVRPEAAALTLDQYGVHLHGKPGEIIRGTIRLTNEKAVPVALDVHSTDHSNQSRLYSKWLTLGSSQLAIQPGASTQLEYTVELPEKASGQFLSRISFTERPREKKRAAVTFLTRMSIHIAATVVGTEIYDGDIQAIEVGNSSCPMIRLVVRNSGNVYVKPKGSCVIFDTASTSKIAETTVNRVGEAVHVGRSERLIGPLDKPLPVGRYRAEVSLAFTEQYSINRTLDFTVHEETQ